MSIWVNLVLTVPKMSPITKESTLKFQGLNSVHSNWTAIGLVNLRSCNHNPGCLGCGKKKVGSGWRFALHRMVELSAKLVGSWFTIVWYVQYPSIFLPHGCNSLAIVSTFELPGGTNLYPWWIERLLCYDHGVYRIPQVFCVRPTFESSFSG